MVPNDFSDDEVEEFLGERGVQPQACIFSEYPQLTGGLTPSSA